MALVQMTEARQRLMGAALERRRVRARAWPDQTQGPATPQILRANLFADHPPTTDQNRSIFGRGLTLDRIATAIDQADYGAMADLTDLSRETIDTDPHLSAVLNKRTGALASLEPRVEPASGMGINKERAEFYAEVVRHQIDQIPRLAMRIRQLAWALFDGRAALENDWHQIADGPEHPVWGKPRWAIRGLGWIHPRRLSFGPDRELRVVDGISGGAFSKVGFALRDFPWKFISFTPQLFGEYQEREGLARRCLYWSFFKRFAARERQVLTELFAKPWRWLEVAQDSEADDDDIEAAMEFVEALPLNGWGSIPRGTELKTETPDTKSSVLFSDIIEQSDAQNSKLVLGQTGTTDGEAMGLNSAQARVMRSEQLMILLADSMAAAESLEDGFGDAIVAVNFGSEALSHAPHITLPTELDDPEYNLALIKTALDLGLRVPLTDAFQKSGLREPKADEPFVELDFGGVTTQAVPRVVVPVLGLEGEPVEAKPPEDPSPAPSPPEGGDGGEPGGSPEEGGEPPLVPPGPIGDGGEEPTDAEPGDETGPRGPMSAERGPDPIPLPPHVEAIIRQEGDKFVIYSEDGKEKLGEFDTREEAEKRLEEIERIKRAKRMVDVTDLPRIESMADAAPAIEAVLGGVRAAHVIEAIERSEAPSVSTIAVREHGACVRLAKQPETVNGTPETIIDRGVRELARETQRMGLQIAESTEGLSTGPDIFRATNEAVTERIDLSRMARALERRLVHGIMLGAYDHFIEREEGVIIAPEKFTRGEGDPLELAAVPEGADPKFASMPFDRARRFFVEKQVLRKDLFEQLSAGAKRRAFTIARLNSQNLLELAHSELGKMITAGFDLRDFRKFMAARIESAGWTPANPSHVETVARTNVTQAHAVGRLSDMNQPEVRRSRPYWQIRTVKDARQRRTHGKVDGWTLRADDPFWDRAFPGNFGYNCRCRAVTLSERQVQSRGITVRNGADISGLPDSGFSGGGARSLVSSYL